MLSSSRHMALVALLAISSIPWLASAKATSKLVGYSDPLELGNAEQVQFDADKQVVYVIEGQNLRVLDAKPVIDAALAGTAASAPNMPLLYNVTPQVDIQDVAYCSSKKGSFVAICTAGAGGKTSPGSVFVYDTKNARNSLTLVASATVGALPDQLTFMKEGDKCAKILTANEGEPISYDPKNRDDPEGSVSVIELNYKKRGKVELEVKTAGFTAFNSLKTALNAEGVRIFGPDASVAQDLEPECVTYSEDGKWAYVSLQENNALATIRLEGKDAPQVVDLLPLGLQDYSAGNPNNNALDPSDRDNDANGGPNNDAKIAQYPVLGMYQPDEIKAFTHKGVYYLVLANEGDARDWQGFKEDQRLGEFALPKLDPAKFPNPATLEANAVLGRLQISTVNANGNVQTSNLTSIYAFGARSFSILRMRKDGKGFSMVYNSGRLLEELTKDLPTTAPQSDACPINSGLLFNYGGGCFDTRSDDKGPEPEGLDIGYVGKQRLLFLTLERSDLVAVFDISDPKRPVHVEFLRAPGQGPTGDSRRWRAPEGVTFGSVRVKNSYARRGKSTKLNLVFTAWEAANSGGVTAHVLPSK